jgi:hypothetical protein
VPKSKTDENGRVIEWWECDYGCGAKFVIEAKLNEKLIELAAWQSAFGTTQLTHATERLRLAESDRDLTKRDHARIKKALHRARENALEILEDTEKRLQDDRAEEAKRLGAVVRGDEHNNLD